MQTISGHFKSSDEARRAIHAQEDAGVASDDISVISADAPSDETAAATHRVAVGASVGGLGGLLAGLGAFAIPGVGPVVGAAWVATTVVGALAGGVAGGLVGSLTAAPSRENSASLSNRHKRCGSLVIARVDESEAGRARTILQLCGRLDAETRRDIRGGDWDGFIGRDIWDDDIGSEDGDRQQRRLS